MNNDGRAPEQTTPPLQQAPQKTPATDEQKQTARTFLWVFFALIVALLLTSGLALPWKLVPLALGVAAVVVGIMTLVKVLRSAVGPLPVFVTILGLVASVLMTTVLGLAVATWDSTQNLETCMHNALTTQAEEQCKADFTSGIFPR